MAAREARRKRCAIYTRKSSEEGLEQDFNSLDAQREACEAYVKSQSGEGWRLIRTHYDDGGFSGGTMQRPALGQLLADIEQQKVDTIVVYKVDRLTRSLADFAKIVEVLDAHEVSFVSVTQQFNTTTSMGRLTLNMLLSFAQFEREVTGERIRDKIAASKRKGLWMGGPVPLGYEPNGRTLNIVEAEADTVRTVFRLYLELGNVRRVKEEADRLGLTTKKRSSQDQRIRGGRPLSRGYIYHLLSNPHYIGRIPHKGESYEGQHPSIVDLAVWKAVQEKLDVQALGQPETTRRRTRSPLQGKLFDEAGRPLTPSHTVKKGRRYRYYVSRGPCSAEHRNAKDSLSTAWRLPAREIEQVLERAVSKVLTDQIQLNSGSLEAGSDVSALWSFAARTLRLEGKPLDLLRRADLGSGSVTIAIDIPCAAARSSEMLRRVIPISLRRRGVETRLIVDSADGDGPIVGVDPTLLRSVVRARRWFDNLATGRVQSLAAIAQAEGISAQYVGNVIPLAFLAPEILSAIFSGTQPADLTAEALVKRIDLSTSWPTQRTQLGFE